MNNYMRGYIDGFSKAIKINKWHDTDKELPSCNEAVIIKTSEGFYDIAWLESYEATRSEVTNVVWTTGRGTCKDGVQWKYIQNHRLSDEEAVDILINYLIDDSSVSEERVSIALEEVLRKLGHVDEKKLKVIL